MRAHPKCDKRADSTLDSQFIYDVGFGFPTLDGFKHRDPIVRPYPMNSSPFSLAAPQALTVPCFLLFRSPQNPPILHSHPLFIAQD